MTPDWDSDAIDEAAEDPPLTWLAVAVFGLFVAVVGFVATALWLTGHSAGVRAAVPALGVLFDMSVPVLLVGIGLFVLSMTEWDPDLNP